jgi:hypothetical protein
MKKRNLFMTVPAMVFSLAVMASGVNLSGAWILDKDKSDAPRFGPGGGGTGGGGGQGSAPDITLVIRQTDNVLQITRKVSRRGQERSVEQKFTLDGQDNTNPAGMGRAGSGELKSKAKWNKDRLVIEGTQKINSPRGDFDLQVKEEFSLSADGKTLTVQTTRDTPMGENTSKQVFTKK